MESVFSLRTIALLLHGLRGGSRSVQRRSDSESLPLRKKLPFLDAHLPRGLQGPH
jgi:hypothetical protein